MCIIPDAYYDDYPLIVQPIAWNLIAVHNITQNVTRMIRLSGYRILKFIRHQYNKESLYFLDDKSNACLLLICEFAGYTTLLLYEADPKSCDD